MDNTLNEIPCDRCGTVTREIKQVPANGHYHCFRCYSENIAGTWLEQVPRTVTKAAKEIGPGDEIVWFYFAPEEGREAVIARRKVIEAFTEIIGGVPTTSIWLQSGLPQPLCLEFLWGEEKLEVVANV